LSFQERRRWRKLTTLVAAEVTTAVAASPHRGSGGLRLDIALGGARNGLVNGLDGDDGLLLAVGVVASSVKLGSVSCEGAESHSKVCEAEEGEEVPR
jgi:hypothetical protein